MPKFILGNRKTFRGENFEYLFNASPPQVFLMRHTSAWCTHEDMVQMVRVLGAVCRAHRPIHTAILCFDTAPCHTHETVWSTCLPEGIRPLIVPARCTSLLQPLDVYDIRTFKEGLRREFDDRYSEDFENVSLAWFLEVLYRVIHQVIQERAWPHSFARIGLA